MQYEENFTQDYPIVEPNRAGSSGDSSLTDLWRVVLSALKEEVDSQLFDAYIRPLAPVSIDYDKNELTIAAPSKFVIDKAERSYNHKINSVVKDQLSVSSFNIVYFVDPSKCAIAEPSSTVPTIKPATTPVAKHAVIKKLSAGPSVSQSNKTSNQNGHSSVQNGNGRVTSVDQTSFPNNLNSRYTFSNFIVGNSNQFCNAAARQVSDGPGQTYNPLFIYGGVGLGKTHLLHAIGNAALERNPETKIVYMSSESFTNELIQGLRTGKMDDFKKRLRECDILLIDDIQFISGKERTQEEFFHTFNTLYSAKRQIVITSDSTPQEIDGLKERLQTRFSWGLLADLQAPDFETRVAILNRKAAIDSFVLPMEVAHYIAENISTNVRELEGALTRLSAVCSLQGVGVSRALAESVLKPMMKSKPANITVDDIKRVVSTHFGLKISDLSSKKRSRSFSFPRHIAMYLCRKHTTCSYPDIGDQFGGRDHSSVIHAANVVGKKLKTEAEVRAIMDRVQELLVHG